MLAPLLLAVLPAGIHALSAQEPGAAPLDSLHRLRFLLKARDQAIASLAMRYEASQPEEASASASAGAGSGCTWVEKGLWLMADENRCCLALAGCLEGEPTLSWSYWDGVAGYVAGRGARWEESGRLLPDPPPSFDLYERTSRPSVGQLSYAYLPDRLGLGMANVLWGDYLDVFSDVKVLGTRQVGGASCLAVLMDMDRGQEDGEYTFPWVVNFDEETLLAVRTTFFQAADASTAPGESPGDGLQPEWLTLGDGRWRARQTIEVDASEEVEPGLWIGTRGRVVQFTPARTIVTRVRVDPQSIRLNAAAPPWLDGFHPPPGASVR